MEFPTDLPWLTAGHDSEQEHQVWSEQRMRKQIERFNAGDGRRGERSSQSRLLKDLIERGPWRDLGVPDLSELSALGSNCC